MICLLPGFASSSFSAMPPAGYRRHLKNGLRIWPAVWLFLLPMFPLLPSAVLAQANLALSDTVQATCGSSPVVNFQFRQLSPANVFSLQFDVRFYVSQFQSVFNDDNDFENDKPVIQKIPGTLPDHSIVIFPVPESDPAADGNPETAQWRVAIYDDSAPFALIPEDTLLSLQFFTASTATNGPHALEMVSSSGSDDIGQAIWTLTTSNGQITLSGCSTQNRLSLPAIIRQ
jgi:hypothetical protein